MKKHIEEYHNYLKSEKWASIREELFKERGRKCERFEKGKCCSKIEVHHKTYRSIFNEKLEDFKNHVISFGIDADLYTVARIITAEKVSDLEDVEFKGKEALIKAMEEWQEEELFTNNEQEENVNKEQEMFTLEQLISFGYYARRHPDTVMRQNYIAWKEEFEPAFKK